MNKKSFLLAIVAITTGCGGSDNSSPVTTEVSPTPPPVAAAAPASTPQPGIDSMLGIPSLYLSVTRATLDLTFYRNSTGPRPGDQCGQSGSQQITVDGAPWTAQANLPAGKHTLTGRFEKCRFSGPMEDIMLNGSVDMVYEGTAPENVAAVLTTKAFSLSGFGSDALPMYTFQVDGPAVYFVERTQNESRFRTDLRPGASLTNSKNTNRIDFVGGRYALTFITPSNPMSQAEEFLEVVLEFNGVRYRLDGRMEWFNSETRNVTCTGEVRITDGDGGLVARKYCTAGGRTESELLKPLPVFW
jgi:hypothetical protein